MLCKHEVVGSIPSGSTSLDGALDVAVQIEIRSQNSGWTSERNSGSLIVCLLILSPALARSS